MDIYSKITKNILLKKAVYILVELQTMCFKENWSTNHFIWS